MPSDRRGQYKNQFPLQHPGVSRPDVLYKRAEGRSSLDTARRSGLTDQARRSHKASEWLGNRMTRRLHCSIVLETAPVHRSSFQLIGKAQSTSPWLRLALAALKVQALKIERHRSADEILQRRLIDLLALVDVDR